MLLAQAHGPQLPVGHLLALANLEAKDFLGDLGQPRLLPCHVDLRVIGLSVYKVAHVLIEIHSWQMLSEDVHIGLEAEANVNSLLMGEELSQDLVQHLAVSQRDQVDQVGVLLVR